MTVAYRRLYQSLLRGSFDKIYFEPKTHYDQCRTILQPNQQEEYTYALSQNPYQGITRRIPSRKARDGAA